MFSARRAVIMLLFGIGAALGLFVQLSSAQSADKSTDNTIKFYQWRITRDPDDFFNYDKLGTAYIGKARETGDITYYNLAEQALKKSLDLESTHREAISATVHLASVYLSEHRFQDAFDFAQKGLGFGTGDLSPYAIEGDALLELGQYDRASAAYDKLQPGPNDLALHAGLQYLRETRASNLAFLRGEPDESIHHMRNAVQIAMDSQMPKESVAWTQFTLGEELFQTGDLPGAEQAEEDALKTYGEYHRALADLAKVRCAQGKLQEAVDLYKRALAVIPMPIYAAALGDIYTKMGRTAEAKQQYDLVEFIAQVSAIGKVVYNRELSLFYADHEIKLKDSLEFARRELEVRQDIYTWDALAWALYKNRNFSEAADAMTKALALHTKDALLFFHAGMIYSAINDNQKANAYLSNALRINPQFHVFYADLARQKLHELDAHGT